MKTQKNIGIWMDHAVAQLIDLNAKEKSHNIISKFTFDTKEEALNRSESIMNNKRQQMQEAYYKEIAKEILKYDHVLLFGPTDAKTELHNYLDKNLHFKDILIDVQTADKMTDHQKEIFVKNHFEK